MTFRTAAVGLKLVLVLIFSPPAQSFSSPDVPTLPVSRKGVLLGRSAPCRIISDNGNVERATTTSGFSNMKVLIHGISLPASELTGTFIRTFSSKLAPGQSVGSVDARDEKRLTSATLRAPVPPSGTRNVSEGLKGPVLLKLHSSEGSEEERG